MHVHLTKKIRLYITIFSRQSSAKRPGIDSPILTSELRNVRVPIKAKKVFDSNEHVM